MLDISTTRFYWNNKSAREHKERTLSKEDYKKYLENARTLRNKKWRLPPWIGE